MTKDKAGVCTENYCEKWLQQEFNSLVGVFFSKRTVNYICIKKGNSLVSRAFI